MHKFVKVANTGFNVTLLGDIGQAMADGTIKIIDRKKDLVKLQMGEYVSLGKVESILKIHSVIDNICVCARPSESFTVALIVPDENKLKILASELLINQDISFEDMCMDYKVIAEVLRQVTAHGLQMGCEKFEIPKAITLIPEVWTPDSGLVTAAMKLVSLAKLLFSDEFILTEFYFLLFQKRKEIENRFANELNQMYLNALISPQNATANVRNQAVKMSKIAPA